MYRLHKLRKREEIIRRILENGKVIQTKVIQGTGKQLVSATILDGDYTIQSTYFDDEKGEVVKFYFRGNRDRSMNILHPFLQADSISDIKTINVLVNRLNYHEYVVLFREEINVDNSRKIWSFFSSYFDITLYIILVLFVAFSMRFG